MFNVERSMFDVRLCSLGRRGLDAELQVVKMFVPAASVKKFLVPATLDDSAFLDHEDQIGMVNSRQTMRHDNGRSILHQHIHGTLDRAFGFRVQ